MNCMICSKRKEDFEVWHNKVVVAATYDSEFQNHEQIRKMDDKSIICHDCILSIKEEVEKNRK
ncbi:hypothetical protein C5F47_04715 [Nitrosopumilus cobalaminigenes]|uniref:Uncharacterized protein n=1 Tax=Nitrosopumilus cobalaminigenes TaxID=1470066 RepID=A0A7D5R050_9ARCH|nr:hypothetical protein [Nitrosopumilus cobalaminigenes]QLH02898.1 hypothetical protein C5F47_04715 [Nitrosopumilus cobalaminigenes]